MQAFVFRLSSQIDVVRRPLLLHTIEPGTNFRRYVLV